MREECKNIKGYEDLYKISNLGRVKNLKTNKILKLKLRKDGYTQVTLCKKGKQESKYVHRLVCEAFLENPLNLSEVNHKNEIKTDNSINNLEWCSKDYNLHYGTRSIRKQKKIICINTGDIFDSLKEAGEKLGLYPQNICKVCKGKRKTINGLKFMYI